MRSTFLFGLALMLGCATTTLSSRPVQEASATGSSGEKVVAKCHLIGLAAGYAGYNSRNAILDETQTNGPSRVYWINPPTPTVIKTVDGLTYRCDATL
jgi:hypothetical protein